MGCQSLTAKLIYQKHAEAEICNLSKPCIQGGVGGTEWWWRGMGSLVWSWFLVFVRGVFFFWGG